MMTSHSTGNAKQAHELLDRRPVLGSFVSPLNTAVTVQSVQSMHQYLYPFIIAHESIQLESFPPPVCILLKL